MGISRKKTKKYLTGNHYSPYESDKNRNMNEWYTAYLSDSKRMYKQDGLTYTKIIYRFDFYQNSEYEKIVFIETPEPIKIGNILSDEQNREFVVSGFDMHIRFIDNIPEWFLKVIPIRVIGKTNFIGDYLTLKQNTTLKEAYSKAKSIYKNFMRGTCTFEYAREGDSWWFFSFYNFFITPANHHGQLLVKEAGGKSGFTEVLFGCLTGVQIYKKDAEVVLFGSGQIDKFSKMKNNSRLMTEEEVFSYRKNRRLKQHNH